MPAYPRMDSFRSTHLQLPNLIRFGTSSWTYPGWKSLVYHSEYSSEAAFKRDSLAEYAHCPLFQIAGLDSTFYGPPSPTTLRRYQSQTPDHFQFLVKAWEEISIPRYAAHRRYGARAGKENDSFLSAAALGRFLDPFLQTNFESRTAVIVFQFQRLVQEDPSWFIERLDAFCEKLPADFRFAFEVRSPELLQADYFALLNRYGVSHCFNHWTSMPPLSAQMRAAAEAGGLSADFFAARVLTPRGLTYAAAVKRHAPYAEIRTPLSDMRADLVRLAKRALEREVPAFIIVNNRAEGCAPLTIDAVRLLIAQELGLDNS